MNRIYRTACSIVVPLVAVGCTVAPQGAEATEGTGTESSALLTAVSVQAFHGQDARLFNDYDWARGYWKGECGGASPVISGVSVHFAPEAFGATEWSGQALLCAGSQVTVNNGNPSLAVPSQVLWTNGDDRLDTTWGDWAPYDVKSECGPTEVMVGIAEATGTTRNTISAVRCMPGTNIAPPTLCYNAWSSGDDARYSVSGGDWSYGHQKLQCRDGDYVKGFGQYHDMVNYSGSEWPVYSILCCTPNFPVSGGAHGGGGTTVLR